ncbi:TIGR02147 family protein [Pseudobacteriovorax antillogorgiicola]|nr:TIGR02147 family protein [Pseudobacteriovorax antillogorgiicola]
MARALIQEVVDDTHVFDYLDYKSFLGDLYHKLKQSDSQYSYMKFSADLGLTETNVSSHIIHGRRPLTIEAAKKVVKSLGMKKLKRKYFLALTDYINETDPSLRDQKFQSLFAIKQESLPDSLQEQMTYFSQWYYPIIGELARVEGFQADYKWVKKNLWPNITPKQFEKAIEVLKQVKILKDGERSSDLNRTDLDFSPGHATRDISVSKYHQQMIKLAEQGLSAITEKKRNFSSMTVVLSRENAKKLNQLVLEFQRKVLELEASNTAGKDVYQVNVQLFPFTDGDDIWASDSSEG